MSRLLLFVCLVGCSEGGFVGKDMEENVAEDQAPLAKPNEEERPSEDGEGVPGYLTNPELIVIRDEAGKIIVEVPEGGVSGSKSVLEVYQLPATLADSLLSGPDGFVLTTLFAGNLEPTATGAVSGQVDKTNDNPVVLRLVAKATAAAKGSEARLPVPAASDRPNLVLFELGGEAPPQAFDADEAVIVPPPAGGEPPDAPAQPVVTTRIACHAQDKAFVASTKTCGSESLAPLPFCNGEDGNAEKFHDWVDSNFKDDPEDRIKDALDAGHVPDQCYFADAAQKTIAVALIKNGIVKVISVPASQLQKN